MQPASEIPIPPRALRFGGIDRLYGAGAAEKLHAAHVAVIGVGGVGSWTVEALARSGIGALTLIDMDDVCVTNTNRQLPAVKYQYRCFVDSWLTFCSACLSSSL